LSGLVLTFRRAYLQIFPEIFTHSATGQICSIVRKIIENILHSSINSYSCISC